MLSQKPSKRPKKFRWDDPGDEDVQQGTNNDHTSVTDTNELDTDDRTVLFE